MGQKWTVGLGVTFWQLSSPEIYLNSQAQGTPQDGEVMGSYFEVFIN